MAEEAELEPAGGERASDEVAHHRRVVAEMRRFAWLCVAGGIITATGGCSSTLREVRAREPEFRFPGVPASSQFEVARCIRDVVERTGAEVVQEIERAPDGMHVIGRRDERRSAAMYDVAVRDGAVVGMVEPAATDWTAVLRYAVAACIGAQGEQAR